MNSDRVVRKGSLATLSRPSVFPVNLLVLAVFTRHVGIFTAYYDFFSSPYKSATTTYRRQEHFRFVLILLVASLVVPRFCRVVSIRATYLRRRNVIVLGVDVASDGIVGV